MMGIVYIVHCNSCHDIGTQAARDNFQYGVPKMSSMQDILSLKLCGYSKNTVFYSGSSCFNVNVRSRSPLLQHFRFPTLGKGAHDLGNFDLRHTYWPATECFASLKFVTSTVILPWLKLVPMLVSWIYIRDCHGHLSPFQWLILLALQAQPGLSVSAWNSISQLYTHLLSGDLWSPFPSSSGCGRQLHAVLTWRCSYLIDWL